MRPSFAHILRHLATCPEGATSTELMAATGYSRGVTQDATSQLRMDGLIQSDMVQLVPRKMVHTITEQGRRHPELRLPKPEPAAQPVAGPRTHNSSTTGPWIGHRFETTRPGADDHKRHGSLQADGTVKPYRAPMHGCVGAQPTVRSLARG